MKNQYDIIIIGGGLLGCATAYQLAKRKTGNILLLDGNDIASQASARAACLLTRARTKPALMEMVQETYDCINEIEILLGESLGLQQCGSITIASSESSLREVEALEKAANSFGIINERIGYKRIRELLPWINEEAVEVALYMPTDAFIDSAMLCSGYAKAALGLDKETCYDTKCAYDNLLKVPSNATTISLEGGKIYVSGCKSGYFTTYSGGCIIGCVSKTEGYTCPLGSYASKTEACQKCLSGVRKMFLDHSNTCYECCVPQLGFPECDPCSGAPSGSLPSLRM